MAIDGLDVSSEQGNVDWHVTPGILGIAKATEGAYYQDDQLHNNLAGLRAAGKRAGAYHFIRAGMDWGEQARYFLEWVGAPASKDEILALDLEPYPGEPWPLGPDETVADCLVWLERVATWSGIRPWLYTYPSFASMMSEASHFGELAAYPLWWADPSNQNPAPWPPALVQTGQGTVPGVAGDVDLNSLGPAYTNTLPPKPQPTMIGADMDMYVGKLDVAGAVMGNVPVPANTQVALVVMAGGRVIGSWAGDGPFGVPQGAADWATARPRVNVIGLDNAMMAQVVAADDAARK